MVGNPRLLLFDIIRTEKFTMRPYRYPAVCLLACFLTSAPLALAPQALFAADFDITSYGAVAGDAGSDLSAFQQAINAASAGDRVIIPAGTFQISSAIVPKQGVAIVGAGREQSVVEFIGTSNSPLVRINGNSQNDIELTGFTLDGKNSDRATHGILAEFSSGHHIHQMGFRDFVETSDFGSHAIHLRNDVDNTLIEANHFRNIGLNDNFGSAIRMSRGSAFNTIRNNDISGTGRGGVFAEIGATDNVIRGNTIMQSGLFDGDSGAGLGIELWNGSGRTIVEDNVLDHWLSVDRSDLVAVRRNTVVSNDGGPVKFTQFELAGGADNIFTDNQIGAGGKIGFSISAVSDPIAAGGFGSTNVERIFIGRNTFAEGANQNVQFNSGQSSIRQIYLYDNQLIDGDDIQASSNDGTPSGLRIIGSNVKQFVLEGNTISNNANNGIRMFFNSSTAPDGIDKFTYIDNNIENNDGPAFSGSYRLSNVEFDASNVVADNANNFRPFSAGFANAAPDVSLIASGTFNVGEEIDFGFTYSDDSSTAPSEVLWDFDFGLPVIDFMPTYTYDQAGDYNVTLIAWDDDGRAARSTMLISIVDALVGDFNGDSVVDAADYTLWRDTLGSTTDLAADASGNGTIDQEDFDLWKANFGAGQVTNSLAQASAVPEPSSLLLLAALAMIGCLVNRSV